MLAVAAEKYQKLPTAGNCAAYIYNKLQLMQYTLAQWQRSGLKTRRSPDRIQPGTHKIFSQVNDL